MTPFLIFPEYTCKGFVQGFSFLEAGYHWRVFIGYDGEFLDAQCFGNDGQIIKQE